MKTCTKCGLKKELDQFYKDHRLSQGCSSHCKHCINKHRKVYYDPTKNRANKLMASFGITLHEYDALLEAGWLNAHLQDYEIKKLLQS